MKERLISLAWAAPWMLFMGFPLASALESTDATQRAGIIGLCALLAVTNSVTWLTNQMCIRDRARCTVVHVKDDDLWKTEDSSIGTDPIE